jgi:hypothetical protein
VLASTSRSHAPLASDVHHDHVYFLTRGGSSGFDYVAPARRQLHHLAGMFVKWLAGLAEAEGADVFTGFPAVEVLHETIGGRSADRDRGIGTRRAKRPSRLASIFARRSRSWRWRAREPDEGRRAPARRGAHAALCAGIGAVDAPADRAHPHRHTRWGSRSGWKSSAEDSLAVRPRAAGVGCLRA